MAGRRGGEGSERRQRRERKRQARRPGRCGFWQADRERVRARLWGTTRRRMGYTVVNRRWLSDDCTECLCMPQPQPIAQRGAQLSWRAARSGPTIPTVANQAARARLAAPTRTLTYKPQWCNGRLSVRNSFGNANLSLQARKEETNARPDHGQPVLVVSRIPNYPSPNAARTRTQAAANRCPKPTRTPSSGSSCTTRPRI